MITTPSGLQYEDTVVGSGEEAKKGQYVSVQAGFMKTVKLVKNLTQAKTAMTHLNFHWVAAWSSKAGMRACKA